MTTFDDAARKAAEETIENYLHKCALAILAEFILGDNCERYDSLCESHKGDPALLWALKSAMHNHAWVVCGPVSDGMEKLKGEVISGKLFSFDGGVITKHYADLAETFGLLCELAKLQKEVFAFSTIYDQSGNQLFAQKVQEQTFEIFKLLIGPRIAALLDAFDKGAV